MSNFLLSPLPLGVQPPLCPCYTYQWSFAQDTAGLYLQDQVKLPYNFFLLAGARYQYIHQAVATGEAPVELQPSVPLTGQALTPRFGLLWRPQEWLSLYGNYTEGFGPNTAFVYPNELAPPTSAESWEAGAKLEFFGGKLRVTADYFELVKTNVPYADPNPAHFCAGGGGVPGGCSLIAGAARSKGPELDIQGEILPGWSVIASYTNDDVRLTKGTTTPNFTGSRYRTNGGARGRRALSWRRAQPGEPLEDLRIPKQFRPEGLQDRRRIPLHGIAAGQRHRSITPLTSGL